MSNLTSKELKKMYDKKNMKTIQINKLAFKYTIRDYESIIFCYFVFIT